METSFGGPSGGEMAGGAMALGVGMFLFVAFMGLIMLVLTIIIWWKIFAKAGWSGALSLLMLIPLVNLIMAFYVAFATWPIQRELEALKRSQVK